mgnify:CR=1 FL=1
MEDTRQLRNNMIKKNCNNKEGKQDIRIAVIHQQIAELKLFVGEMKGTNLPHIYSKLDEINSKLSKLSIWDKIKSIALVISAGMIGTMATYIFLK